MRLSLIGRVETDEEFLSHRMVPNGIQRLVVQSPLLWPLSSLQDCCSWSQRWDDPVERLFVNLDRLPIEQLALA